MSEKNYYFAVDDVLFLKAKKVNGQVIFSEDSYDKTSSGHHTRFISDKFVDDPCLALINILISDHRDSNNKEKREKLLSEITYNEKENCFIWDEYLTKGTMKWPKQCQWDCFEKGEYEFLVNRHEVQILTSNIAKIDVNNFANNLLKKDIKINVM